MSVRELLQTIGVNASAGEHIVRSPIDGVETGRVAYDDAKSIDAKIARSAEAFRAWRDVPAPKRGELVRLFGEELRANKEALGRLVTLEAGKILQEGLGEVQEMIDICDFAVGLSRQLYGLTIASERPGHRMLETWHPAGPVAVISAFNFPVAVWAWNAALALVCGDSVIWKPSEKTPLTALATQALFERAAKKFGAAPAHLSQLVLGLRDAGEALAKDARIPVVSATGSTRMGRELAPIVAARFGKSILELGGNNAMIVAPSAKLDLAVRAILFAAVGTAGQRCTTLRRLFVHDSLYDTLVPALKKAYAKLPIGSPLEPSTLVGPLIDRQSFDAMERALAAARDEGGRIAGGGRALADKFPNAFYAQPAIVEMPSQTPTVCHETFAPILYVMRYSKLDEALALHNAVPQGLSSCIFTTDLQESERFLAASDCGIANVNIGPSGAEIGGAFGGEKETGGGRESGSDAWKAYMRRQTATINYSDALPLAQGIEFAV
jgi:aldehyde dehydrogenase (NAD+)